MQESVCYNNLTQSDVLIAMTTGPPSWLLKQRC